MIKMIEKCPCLTPRGLPLSVFLLIYLCHEKVRISAAVLEIEPEKRLLLADDNTQSVFCRNISTKIHVFFQWPPGTPTSF